MKPTMQYQTTSEDLLLAEWRTRTTLKVEQAAQVLGTSRGLAFQGVRDGSIPSLRVGRRILVPVAALRRLLGELPEDAGPR